MNATVMSVLIPRYSLDSLPLLLVVRLRSYLGEALLMPFQALEANNFSYGETFMMNISLRLSLALGIFVIYGCYICGGDVNYFKANHACMELVPNNAENRLPISLDKYKCIVSQDGWQLVSPPHNTNEKTLLTPHGKKDSRLIFHWIVIPDRKLQIFDPGLARFEFELINESMCLSKTFSLKSGNTVSYDLWRKPDVIRSPGSFTMCGPIRVNEHEQRLVKLLQETLDEVDDGQIINTWYTDLVSAVVFVRKQNEKKE